MSVKDGVEAHAYIVKQLLDHEVIIAESPEITFTSCEVTAHAFLCPSPTCTQDIEDA